MSWLVLWILLLPPLAASVPLVADAQSPPHVGADEQPFALTISGGVSLGAYEAGLNWAILKALRLEQKSGRIPIPDLVGVTGASAGAINALISALAWCQEGDGLGTFDDNLFRNTWLPIDFKDLLPVDGRGYDLRGDDGLLTRSAFDGIIGDVRDIMQNGAFRPGCYITLGLTVTRPNPKPIRLKGLQITQQRVVLPLELSIRNGKPSFRPMIGTDRDDLYGNTLYLAPQDRDGFVAHEDVIKAVLASSAFPVAFSRMPITECVPLPPGEDTCPYGRPNPARDCTFVTRRLGKKTMACEDDFMDGGVFDNIPLGVAVAQIESSERVRSSARPVSYIYMEPDNRRRSQEAMKENRREPLASMDANLTFVGGMLATARNYELHNVLRYNAWNEHTDDAGFKAAKLLGALARVPGEPDIDAAIMALRALVDSHADAAATIQQCTAPNRPLSPGFSWSVAEPHLGVEIILSAMPCADALLAAQPENAQLRNLYIKVASRSLAVIAASLRRARLRRNSYEAAQFERYRRALLERLMGNEAQATGGAARIEGIDALVASLASSDRQVAPVLARLREAAATIRQDPALHTLVREASALTTDLEALIRAGYLFSAVAAAVATRHRCAATLLASARELEELAVHPLDEDAYATRDRVERVRSALLGIVEAAECPEVTSRTLDESPEPTDAKVRRALAAAAEIAERFDAVVTPHGKRSQDVPAVDSLLKNWVNVGYLATAKDLANKARRKHGSIHEDRMLMLTTRYAPLASSYLSAFSGFLDEPLRHYDYLAGVYDGLHGLAEYLCQAEDALDPARPDWPMNELASGDGTQRHQQCIIENIKEFDRTLAVRDDIVDTLRRLEYAPRAIEGDPMPENRNNVERVMNALFDPKRCREDQIVDKRCVVDSSFGAFVTQLNRRGYRSKSLYMQRALRNPDNWWVTPGMYALRRMQAIEDEKGDENWKRVSVIAQRLYLSLEDRMVTGLAVPSVLPPRFGWGLPWFRLSMTMDWSFSGEGRYRLRPIGYAASSCPLGICGLALYGNAGFRVDDGVTGEAGLTLAWRNAGYVPPVLYGVELAGYADISSSWRPRYEAAVILSTHLRSGVGYSQDDSALYAFLGVDDPIGMISSFLGLLPRWP